VRLYTKEIHVIKVVEHNHFNHDQDDQARPTRSSVLIGSSWPKVLLMGCEVG
jgi:hypothetical protein